MITKQGEIRNIKFYEAGHNPPVFTENGVDFYYGGGIMDENGHGVDGGIRAGKAVQEAYSEQRMR